MSAPRKSTTVFTLIVLAYLLYAGIFIYQTSYLIDGQRYFVLFDDAMISMQYAKNLAHGHGLVWNAGGERVEGYTNPLWVLYMVLLHLLPLATSKVSLLVQITGALLLVANLFFVRKIADLISDGSAFVTTSAVLLTAFYLPLNNWALQGMEVGVLALIISSSLWQALRVLRSEASVRGLYVTLGVGALVRPDMAVPFAAVLVFMVVADAANRRKHLAWGLTLLVCVVLVPTLLRLWYYGDVLPNTYYLKLTGFPLMLRLARGVWVLVEFVLRLGWFAFLMPLSVLFFRRDRSVYLSLTLVATQVAYSVYVGGDAWEDWGGSYRYISIVMPVFFILFSYGLVTNGLRLMGPAARHARAGLAALVGLSLIGFNALNGVDTLREWLLLKAGLDVPRHERVVRRALLVAKITKPEATVAVTWAGALPYFSERYCIDLLGKSDRTIARGEMKNLAGKDAGRLDELMAFKPGHTKWDYDYSIGRLKPDVVANTWRDMETLPYLDRDYEHVTIDGYPLYLRKGSDRILWDRIRSLQ
jgi:hypothetical protein